MEGGASVVQTQTRKRLSIVRLAIVLAIIGGVGYGTTQSFAKWQEEVLNEDHLPWFAGYVDVTSLPTYDFEQRGGMESSDAVLSFIVSSHDDPCVPTWGGYYTLDEAAVSLDLDRRIARFQQRGGRIAVSFGGALNSELALKCLDEAALADAYRAVIERYSVNTIDLDLENEGLTDLEAAKRRAAAIAQLQQEYRAAEKDLAIWLTLPVAPQGLTTAGTDAVALMLAGGVDIAGVNVMTMDYGGSRDENDSMYEASRKALIETHRQLGILYEQSGTYQDGATVWQKLGATPMIGQNDVLGEVFTLEDAVSFNTFALEQGVGRMSIWSANRDIPCGENYVDVKVVSDRCSGVTASPYAFSLALGAGFDGDLMQNAKMLTVEDPRTNVHVEDDPETSPYQIWKETGTYLKGTKVVWHGNVYEAKWWTKNDLPDNPVLQAWETPWMLIGPVLATDRPVERPTLPAGTYPTWSGMRIYDAGDRVLFEGAAYYAKWWNQGQSPAAAASNPDNSPWVPLREEEIILILESLNR
ncbi:MAG: glycosyl hydrolase family 18 [Candidatus Kaiserbacteria bacterium]|nr:glycosyl hydrolase family 18 [Candidatus Kaiserbacteria bacterium]MCB9816799.1 glycosyl hydrolase family 18 [Candidatus Nomurabacteria bacterium]